MFFNHSAWSWNKNLLVLINMPVVKLLSVGENPTANMCIKHITQGKLLETIQVSFSALDILVMKYITKTSLQRRKKKKKFNIFWFIFIQHSPPKSGILKNPKLILPLLNIYETVCTGEFSM